MDRLSELPIDIFIKNITYLPFSDVIKVCGLNKKLHNYCSDSKYNNHWKALIDDTFGTVYGYKDKLKRVWDRLGQDDGSYDYLVYVNLVKELDPITQLMIYYRQGDRESFDNPKFSNLQRFLSLFLLGDSNLINYLPNENYLSYIYMLHNKNIPKNILNYMMIEMAKEGNVKGVILFMNKGVDIHAQNDYALRWASGNGHLEVVKYLVGEGADIHDLDDLALRWASEEGHLDVVKFLVERGADIHTEDDEALRWASEEGHLEVVNYLKSLP